MLKAGSGRFCSHKCAAPARARTHGESRSRLHNIWCGMKSRCKGTAGALAREYYSGRNVTICDAWRDSYLAFRDWARSHGYAAGLELDRIDNAKGYSPDNCRWATRTQQMQNTRKRRDAKTSRFKGVSRHSQNGTWVAQIGAGGRVVFLGCFAAELDAAHAYDAAARERFGEFASLNFKD